jgi:hypothetical protein
VFPTKCCNSLVDSGLESLFSEINVFLKNDPLASQRLEYKKTLSLANGEEDE